MGKLNIAHHKSYHPYRRDNIERVRKDEEEARLQEAKEEGRMMLADSEARIDLLRHRAGFGERENRSNKRKEESELEPDERDSVSASRELPTSNGHINLFHDVEQGMVAALTVAKKAETSASERGFKLAPDEKELKRWYTQRRSSESHIDEDDDGGKGKRDAQRKSKHDPLAAIEQQLASRSQASSASSSQPLRHGRPRPRSSHPPAPTLTSANSSVQARVQRESSERERALALIQRKKKELEGNMTPSTVAGDDDDGYRDVFNRREVEDAHRGRERRRYPKDRRRDW